jgi:hypothetical protein
LDICAASPPPGLFVQTFDLGSGEIILLGDVKADVAQLDHVGNTGTIGILFGRVWGIESVLERVAESVWK